MSDPAVVLEGVTKRFGEKVAVNSLDLVIPQGSVCGFLGPNGAGKTTTIRMLMAILYPDEGALRILDKDSAVEARERIGYLPEERGVYRKMKVGEFLAYIARIKGAPAQGLGARIDRWLERLELPGVRNKRCEQLSKGMQQKVQFIATVIHEPELIILDEPFSGLDPVNARLLRSLIDELHEQGRTIIFSTHVLASAEEVCDRIFMINLGRKVLDGPIEEIRRKFDPKTVVVELESPALAQEATGALEGIEGVASVSTLDGRANGSLEAHLREDADPRRVMLEALQRTPARGVELRKATLEDIFVQLVAPGDSEDSVRAALKADVAGAGV